MPKDVIVHTSIDAKPRSSEAMSVLLLRTTGAKDPKVYRDPTELLANGILETDTLYLQCMALFNQGRTTLADSLIRKVKVAGIDPPAGSAGNPPTFTVAFTAPQFSSALEPDTDYWVRVGGNAQSVVQVTTGSSAPSTAAQMAALFNGAAFTLGGVAFTGASGAGGVVTFAGDVSAQSAPLAPTLEFYADATLDTPMGLLATSYDAAFVNGAKPTTAQEALVDAVQAFREVDDDWFVIITDRTDLPTIDALGAWAESTEPSLGELGAGVEDHRKLYFCQAAASDLFAGPQSSVVALIPKHRRAAGIVAADLNEQTEAAYLGNVAPFFPQSVTYKFKRPQGITLPDLTRAQREALEEANWNFLTEEYEKEYVKNGVCFDGEFIDVQLGADYITYYMRELLYNVFLTNAKIPYTDDGFQLVGEAVFRTLNRAVDLGIIARDPESGMGVYTVQVPRRLDATDDQARARVMPGRQGF